MSNSAGWKTLSGHSGSGRELSAPLDGCGRRRHWGPAHDGHQLSAVEQTLGNPLDVGERYGLDEAVALLDVINPEVVHLDLHQLACDLGGGVEAQCIGAFEVRLGTSEFLLARAGFGQAMNLLLDHLEGLPGAIAAGRG